MRPEIFIAKETIALRILRYLFPRLRSLISDQLVDDVSLHIAKKEEVPDLFEERRLIANELKALEYTYTAQTIENNHAKQNLAFARQNLEKAGIKWEPFYK